MAIVFHIQKEGFRLHDRARLKQWIKAVALKEKKKTGALNFVFMSDEELLRHNRDFLKHNTYTDIITFDYSENDTIHGDILISTDRVYDNAVKFKVDPSEELRRVIIHGVLHLCGYKDKKPADKKVMRRKEEESLKILNADHRNFRN